MAMLPDSEDNLKHSLNEQNVELNTVNTRVNNSVLNT